MNLISKLLPESNVVVDLDLSSKKRVFEQAGLLFENNQQIARSQVFDSLFAREKLGSTGLGQGIAIPHCGTVRITSADPYAPPAIDPRYFTEEADVRAVLSGIRTARGIAWSSALAEWGIEEVSPGLAAVDEESIADHARRYFSSYCHPVGTCMMGEDDEAVVDSSLRVHGLDGLRVADASVMPSIPSNNTNATVYAIAERAADLLRSS
jgi:choline dehydrogenase-like flavoprotein